MADYPGKPFGPFIGVPKDRKKICAVADCPNEGQAFRCPADNTMHFHGCVHYETITDQLYERGITMRHGWGLLCAEHYQVVFEIFNQPKCPLCGRKPAYEGAIYCGAGCAARAEIRK